MYDIAHQTENVLPHYLENISTDYRDFTDRSLSLRHMIQNQIDNQVNIFFSMDRRYLWACGLCRCLWTFSEAG